MAKNFSSTFSVSKETLIPRWDGQPYTILLAEDSPIHQRLAEIVLVEQLHCNLTIAHNGKEALEKILNHSFDLIFMDCSMPVMDGFSAVQSLRSFEVSGIYLKENIKKHIQHIPVIALTSHAMQEDAKRCLDAGMDAYLPKPIRVEAVIAVINHWCAVTPDKAELW